MPGDYNPNCNRHMATGNGIQTQAIAPEIRQKVLLVLVYLQLITNANISAIIPMQKCRLFRTRCPSSEPS